MSKNTITDTEEKEFDDFMKKWAYKKIRKLERKLMQYAHLYFGEPVTIAYIRPGTKIIRHDSTEGEIQE